MKIELGKIPGTDFKVYHDSEKAINNSILAFGASGSGKTVSMLRAICDIANDKRSTVIVISWHKSLTEDQIFDPLKDTFNAHMKEIKVHKEGLHLDLFKRLSFDNESESSYSTADSVADIICRAVKLKGKSASVLKLACRRVCEDGSYEEKGLAAIGDALQVMDTRTSISVWEDLQPLLDQDLFHPGNDIEKGKINVIQLSRLNTDTQELVTEIILSYLWRMGNADEYTIDSPVYLFLDECQNANHSERSALPMLISEGRKMHIHLLLATQLVLQSSTNTVHQRLTQAGLILYFKPVANRVGMTARMISQSNADVWAEKLATLKVGHFIAVGGVMIEGRRADYPVVVDGMIDDVKYPVFATEDFDETELTNGRMEDE